MRRKYGLTLFGAGMLSLSLLLAACDSGKASTKVSTKVSTEEALQIIQRSQIVPEGGLEGNLVEITPPDIWTKTNSQLFRMPGTGSLETYVVANHKAVRIGNGFGGYGVTSAVPFDANEDGTMDLVYAYSFGSGIHRSVISWLDLSDLTEHTVETRGTAADVPETERFRTYDLILSVGDKEIVVHRIEEGQNREETSKALMAYPTTKDIESMTLTKDSVLVREHNELYNEKVDEG